MVRPKSNGRNRLTCLFLAFSTFIQSCVPEYGKLHCLKSRKSPMDVFLFLTGVQALEQLVEEAFGLSFR